MRLPRKLLKAAVPDLDEAPLRAITKDAPGLFLLRSYLRATALERFDEPEICERNRASAKNIFGLLCEIGYQVFQIDESSCHESLINDFDLDNIDGFKGSNFIAHAI